ncbi:MAG TPA: hypothetical protein VMX16_14930 [Terriglobia bacterium]|nr:hypothetical protein [Terriglobia bacterium]
MNLLPYVIGFGVLVLTIAVMAIYRLSVGRRDDEMLHLAESENRMVAQQVSTGKKIVWADFWGQLLTVVTAIYGLALLVIYLRGVWVEHVQIPK